MKKVLLTVPFLLCLLLAGIANAQVMSKNFLTYKDVKEIKTRKLVVELLKENPAYITKLTDAGKLKEVEFYKDWVENYNKMMQKYVRDYWKLNTDIDYKTTEEIKAIPEAEKKQYMLLLYTELDDAATDVFNHEELMIPALLYHRAEMPFKKPDVKFPIPGSYARERGVLERTDFISALMLLQNEVTNYIAHEKGDVKTSYANYIKGMAKENCYEIEDKTLLIEPAITADGFNLETIKTKMKCEIPITLSGAEDNNDIVYNQTEKYMLMLTIPVNYQKSTVMNAPYVFKKESVAYAKVIMDTKEFMIINMVWPNFSTPFDYTVKELNFKKLCICQD